MDAVRFGILHVIARRVAGTWPQRFDDIYQDIWVRFLRYQPETARGAWVMAKSARNDLWRRERVRRTVPLEEAEALTVELEEIVEARERLREVVERVPSAVRLLLMTEPDGKTQPGKVRAARHRARRRSIGD